MRVDACVCVARLPRAQDARASRPTPPPIHTHTHKQIAGQPRNVDAAMGYPRDAVPGVLSDMR